MCAKKLEQKTSFYTVLTRF